MTDSLPADHWPGFIEFCRAEVASGGPDPQVKVIAAATPEWDEVAAAWSAGAFVVPYTCGAAAAIWTRYGLRLDDDKLRVWLLRHEAGLPTRRERRVIWGADKAKMTESLTSWAWFVEIMPWDTMSYDELYRAVKEHVRFFGRYAAMKVIEVMNRRGLIPEGQTDIRPHGATYPRRTLGLLYPEYETDVTAKSNSSNTIDMVNGLAVHARAWLSEQGVETSWFDFETLLCNYRQSLNGKYPGRSQDRELAHWRTAEGYWGVELKNELAFYTIRHELFLPEYLGELGDPPWWASRPELEGKG